MYWVYELNKMCCEEKRAHIRLKDGSEFDCRPDCLTYDGGGNEEITVELEDGRLRSLAEHEITSAEEIE